MPTFNNSLYDILGVEQFASADDGPIIFFTVAVGH